MTILCRVSDLQLCWPGACRWNHECITIHTEKCYQIRGVNGVGKSTWVQAALGLLPSAKSVQWTRPVVDGVAKKPDFFFPLTVDRDVSMCLIEVIEQEYVLREGCSPKGRNVQHWLESLGLWDVRSVSWCRLSSGQRQLGRLVPLLYTRSAVWWLDEPWVHLDDKRKICMQELMAQHLCHGGAAVVISHDSFCNNVETMTLVRRSM